MFSKIWNWVSNPLALYGVVLSLAGIAVTYVDAGLSFDFGATVSDKTGWGMWAFAIGSGILPVFVVMFWRQGYEFFARCLAGGFIAIFLVNVMSNMPVATANRVVEADAAGLQKAKFLGNQKTGENAAANIQQFSIRKEKLLDRLDRLFVELNAQKGIKKTVGNWSVLVAPTSIDSAARMIAEKEQERAREAMRGCRQPPCKGPAYERMSGQIQQLVAAKGIVSEIETIKSKINASERVVAGSRAFLKASNAEGSGINHTVAAASFASRWTFGWWGNDSEKALKVRTATEALGVVMALGLAIAGPMFNLAGAFPYLMKITPDTGARPLTSSAEASPTPDVQSSRKDVAPVPPHMVDLSVTTQGALNVARLRQLLDRSQVQVAA